jgi:hypothetical protein
MFILFFIGINVSCSNELSQPTDIATSIEITYQTGPEISPGGEVLAWINNTTDNCINFPTDFGIKVFVLQGEDWLEVQNLVTYESDEPQVVLEPKGEMFSRNLVHIWPDVSSLIITEPVDSYALITGHLCEDENYAIEKKIPFVIIP